MLMKLYEIGWVVVVVPVVLKVSFMIDLMVGKNWCFTKREVHPLLNSSPKLCIGLLRLYLSCFTYFVTGRQCQQGSSSFIVQIVSKHQKMKKNPCWHGHMYT